MENMIKLKYFYGDEPDKLCFYRIPKVLFTKEYFSGLSTDAKVLYGLMLDQMSMSRENRWLDHIDCSKPLKITGYYPQIQRQDRQDGIQPDKADYIEYLKRNIGYDGMIRIIDPGAKAYSNCECVKLPNNGQMEALEAVKQVMESI